MHTADEQTRHISISSVAAEAPRVPAYVGARTSVAIASCSRRSTMRSRVICCTRQKSACVESPASWHACKVKSGTHA